MGSSCTSSNAIGFCVALIVVQSFGELILLRGPTKDRAVRELTCVSEDDESALIWNFNPDASVAESVKNNFTNFQPKKPTSYDVSACAIRDSTSCVAKWGKGTEEWKVVNSAVIPMGPVFDYRWESFREFTFEDERSEKEYQYVGEVEKSGTIVFSVRALREAHVLLCKNEKPTKGPCFWIIIGGSNGQQSEIRTCSTVAPGIPRSRDNQSCEGVTSTKHGVKDAVDLSEWRTFTINLIRKDRTIQVFKETNRKKELLLEGTLRKWHDVSHISVGGEIGARFRFHFYDYFITKDKSTDLRTEEFNEFDEHFCVDMLVGLCPRCTFRISLLDKRGGRIELGDIYGNKNLSYNDVPAWQSVRLSNDINPKGQKLEIRTIRNSKSREGQWAIGGLHTCRSIGGLRESTITINRYSTDLFWPDVRCQKLSYSNSAVVNQSFIIASKEDAHQIQQFVGEWTKSCSSSCPSFTGMTSFCSPAGCTCARGSKGIDCEEECLRGYHGYNCNQTCGSCNEGTCDAKTGYCSTGCVDNKLLPPLCEAALEDLEIVDITNTTARAVQRVKLEPGVKIDFRLEIEGTGVVHKLTPQPNREDLSIYEANITNLEPNRTYTLRRIAQVTFEKHSSYVRDQSFKFTTTDGNPRTVVTPVIKNLKIDRISDREVKLSWKGLPPENGVRPEYNASIKLDKLLGCEELNRSTPGQEEISQIVNSAPVTFSDLHPYAIYTVTVTAHYTTISGKPATKDIQTLETRIPTSKVSNLRVTDRKDSLEWDSPTNCTTITGPTNATRLYLDDVSNPGRNWNASKQTRLHHLLLSRVKLPPHTRYRVRAYVIRDFDLPENPDIYSEITGLTPPAAPSAVTKLEIYEADSETNTTSIRWAPPNPANGEIESYKVSISNQNDPRHENRIMIVTEDKLSCAKKGDYVCYRNLLLPPNVITKDTEILVSAKNKDVEEFGLSSPKLLVWDSYFKVHSQPQNLTAIQEANGTVNLTWSHPSIAYIKIVRFLIKVEFRNSNLLMKETIKAQFPMTTEYSVLQYNKIYTKKLYLPTSSSYRITVTAMNINNLESSQAMVNISVNDAEAFLSEGTLEVSQNGTLIDLKIPGVVNATENTVVTVTVKGFLTCTMKSEKSSLPSDQSKWVADEYKPDKSPKTLTIGANQNANVPMNCSLHLGETYDIIVNIKDRPSVSKLSAKILMASSITLAVNEKSRSTWWIILPIIAVGLLLTLYILHRKRKRSTTQVRYADVLRKTSLENLANDCNRQSSTPPPCTLIEDPLSHIYAVPYVSDSKTVSLKCFEEYTKESASNGQLNSQYTTFPRGLTKPCEYGRLPQNMPKNRNKNLIAYDETRVVLDKIPGDDYSDYINANYIKGYSGDAAYIATQGPKPNTINDFWRMIWQKKVRVICMLTNLVEDGKTMCEQYWPEVGTEVQHGEIKVANVDRKVFADYTFRTLELKMSNSRESRRVTHLHYTSWPNHGVPMYSQSLVTFLKKLVEILDGHGPVVIHCSEGTGRTGTIILCDMCIRQGIVERELDVAAIAKQMYESRANMLDSPQQYLLAHVIITESTMSTPTQIPCTDVLPTRIKTLRKMLPSHIRRLNDTVWQEQALHSLAGSQRKISGRLGNTGLPELIPVTYEVVQNSLYSGFDSDTNYISAVSVDGVKVKEQYLASQLPLPSNLPDFWRYIAERNIELVIMLQRREPNDPMFCDVMPGDSILVPVPYIQVETKSSMKEEELYTMDKLLLTDTSEKNARQQHVTFLTCHGWACGEKGKPPTPAALVSLWRASENIPRQDGLTLVLCQDGVTACGLYLALSFLLERMAVEKECDVISAVRAVRRSRPEFVQSLEQFDYLYDAAINYIESFQTYANFS